jgi:hypothetical protein
MSRLDVNEHWVVLQCQATLGSPHDYVSSPKRGYGLQARFCAEVLRHAPDKAPSFASRNLCAGAHAPGMAAMQQGHPHPHPGAAMMAPGHPHAMAMADEQGHVVAIEGPRPDSIYRRALVW